MINYVAQTQWFLPLVTLYEICRICALLTTNRIALAGSCAIAMALKRFTSTVDGTIPVPALLYEDEVLLSSQDGVGIYDG